MTTPRRALIVIDVQNDYFDGPLEIQYPDKGVSFGNILRAMDIAREARIPTLTVQHMFPAQAPVFAEGSDGARLHPEIERRAEEAQKHVVKQVASVFAIDGVSDWLREQQVDTVTLVGYMTNNCVIGTAAAAEPLGFSVEVLADATGALNLSNDAGSASAKQIHETLLTILHSNWAAVHSTEDWASALATGTMLGRSDLGASAVAGKALS